VLLGGGGGHSAWAYRFRGHNSGPARPPPEGFMVIDKGKGEKGNSIEKRVLPYYRLTVQIKLCGIAPYMLGQGREMRIYYVERNCGVDVRGGKSTMQHVRV